METTKDCFKQGDPGDPNDLSPEHRKIIQRAERGIAKLNTAGDQLARDLLAVKELRLYRRTHSSWAAWCDDLDFSKKYADRLVWFARCQEEMGPNGPTTEGAARRLSGIPVEKLRDLAAAFEVNGGMSTADTEDIDRFAREFRGDPPVRMTPTKNKGIVPYADTGVSKGLRALVAASRLITRGGPHLIEDHMAKATELERAEAFRCVREVTLLLTQFDRYYDKERDAPAQQEWPVKARGERRDAMPVIEVFETALLSGVAG